MRIAVTGGESKTRTLRAISKRKGWEWKNLKTLKVLSLCSRWDWNELRRWTREEQVAKGSEPLGSAGSECVYNSVHTVLLSADPGAPGTPWRYLLVSVHGSSSPHVICPVFYCELIFSRVCFSCVTALCSVLWQGFYTEGFPISCLLDAEAFDCLRPDIMLVSLLGAHRPPRQ